MHPRTRKQSAYYQAGHYVVSHVSYNDIALRAGPIATVTACINYFFNLTGFICQTNKIDSLSHAAQMAWNRKGAGFGYNILNANCKTAVMFLSREYIQNGLHLAKPNHPHNEHYANFFGGAIGTLLTFPLSVLKFRAMNQDNTHLSFKLRYKGLPIKMVRDSWHWGFMLGIRKELDAFFHYQKQNGCNSFEAFNNRPFKVLLSGMITATFTNFLQNLCVNQETTGKNLLTTTNMIIQRQGIKGLLGAGMFMSWTQVGIQSAVVDCVFHKTNHAHGKKQHEHGVHAPSDEHQNKFRRL